MRRHQAFASAPVAGPYRRFVQLTRLDQDGLEPAQVLAELIAILVIFLRAFNGAIHAVYDGARPSDDGQVLRRLERSFRRALEERGGAVKHRDSAPSHLRQQGFATQARRNVSRVWTTANQPAGLRINQVCTETRTNQSRWQFGKMWVCEYGGCLVTWVQEERERRGRV